MDTGTVAASVAVVAALIATVNYFLGPTYDPKEPPVIHQRIPFLGHIIGLLQYGLIYFEILSTKYPLPAFTLQTLGTKTYVINSPDLIQAVQKNAKTLAFYPFVSFMSPRIFGCDEKANAIISDNIDGKRGNWGLLPDITRGMHTAMIPSASLDWMTKTMLTKLMEYFDPLAANGDGAQIDLYQWVRTAFTVSSTEAAYGPKNPFNHQPELEAAFWDFESSITMMLLGIAPSITARKGYQARITFAKALDKYFEDGGPATGSDLIRARWEGNLKYDAAKYSGVFEVGDLIALLVNATPTFFWMLLHIYSRPDVLTDLRTEISGVTNEATESTPTGVKVTRSIVVSRLKEHCPLLLSTYQETMRVQTHNSSSRWVLEDTVIAEQYLLKAGNIVQMPGYPVHIMPSIYGVDAKTFKADRFIKMDKGKEKSRQHPASFRSFGGGATLCPGRHFATAELCAATAMFIMQFDMEPVKGPWRILDWEHGKVVSAVPPPAKDVKVRVSKRNGVEDVAWKFGFEGNVSRFEVLSG